jgi:hypothetical protein
MHAPRSFSLRASALQLRTASLTALLVLSLGAVHASAQQVAPVRPVRPDSALSRPAAETSPRGAFLRAVLVPGWGHASIGSYRRGAFYFVAESATGWALTKAIQRVHEAQGRIRFRESELRAQLAADGVVDPQEIQAGLDDDAVLQDLNDLEVARRMQREDWTSLAIFLVFLSGADAYVSAHLRHFPAPIQLDAQPAGNGRMELSFGITPPR